jgi:hypothetical protein
MMGPMATRLLVFLILFLAGSVCTNLTLGKHTVPVEHPAANPH